jgi:hypothetical protein
MIGTGHCALRKHLPVMGIFNNATCRGCASEDKTAFYILCDCKAYAAHRSFDHLGSNFVEPGEMRNISVGCKLRFINAMGLPL